MNIEQINTKKYLLTCQVKKKQKKKQQLKVYPKVKGFPSLCSYVVFHCAVCLCTPCPCPCSSSRCGWMLELKSSSPTPSAWAASPLWEVTTPMTITATGKNKRNGLRLLAGWFGDDFPVFVVWSCWTRFHLHIFYRWLSFLHTTCAWKSASPPV